MGLRMFGQTMGKFSLNQIPMPKHKFTIANFIILIWPNFRRQSLSYKSFGGFLYVGGIMKAFCLFGYSSFLFCVSSDFMVMHL